MNDPKALTHPQIRDREALGEFFDSLADKTPIIERDVARLRRDPKDPALIADLFRALHNIKGDAAICKVEVAVLMAHPLETLLSRVRTGEIGFSDLTAEVLLLTLDRLEMATEALVSNRAIDHLNLPELVKRLDAMSTAGENVLDTQAMDLIEAVTGFRPRQARGVPSSKAGMGASGQAAVDEDLHFFQALALQLDARSPLFHGRSGRLLRMALNTNAAAGNPVDSAQLEAAVYMHDLGMMVLPESVWLKVGKLTDEDKQLLRAHPSYGAGLLARMPAWSEAAQIVAQHHEMPDGGGYPIGLREADIHPGAQILAIVDAFEAVTLKHRDRGQSRSLLRAIAEINACDKQFSPVWIGHFNGVIRKMLEN